MDFGLGLGHFPGGGGQLFGGFQGDEGYLRGALAPGHPGHVHGHVAAADDRHPFALGGGCRPWSSLP